MTIEQMIESGALRLFKGGVIDDNTDTVLSVDDFQNFDL